MDLDSLILAYTWRESGERAERDLRYRRNETDDLKHFGERDAHGSGVATWLHLKVHSVYLMDFIFIFHTLNL